MIKTELFCLFVCNSNHQATELLITELSAILQNPINENDLFTWLMYHLGKIQSWLTADQTPQNIKKYLFAIDIFCLCIILQTTGKLFHSFINPSNRNVWICDFPEALWLISERGSWKDSMARVS